jgi:hypothetical protein
MTGLQRDCEFGHERHGRRQRSNAQVRLSTGLEPEYVLAHRSSVADETMCPKQHALALGRKSLESRRALYKGCVESLLETLNAERKGRLGYSATFRSASKMLLA